MSLLLLFASQQGASGALASAGVATAAFIGAATGSGDLQTAGLATAFFNGSSAAVGTLSVAGSASVSFFSQQVTGALASAGSAAVAFTGSLIIRVPLVTSGQANVDMRGAARNDQRFSMAGVGSAAFASPAQMSAIYGTRGGGSWGQGFPWVQRTPGVWVKSVQVYVSENGLWKPLLS
jgi:hypothetical protein